MKTLYIECSMGAAGDMLTAALLELFQDPETELRALNEMGLEGVRIDREQVMRCGICGTHMHVSVDGVCAHEVICKQEPAHGHEHGHLHEHGSVHHEHEHDREHHAHGHHHDHAHHHTSMQDIIQSIQSLAVSDKVKENAISVYGLIAEAESHAHAKPVTQIHFHEVGCKDAIADIVSVCYLMDRLSPDRVIVSPIHVGSGHVHCAHGILPVPAPATAYLLQDIPIYQGSIQSELCTPTGAALLKFFATSFGPMPVMRLQKTGYGMGYKEFAQANCVRTFLGETSKEEEIVELSCNIDDMTGEELGFLAERLREEGALDVFLTSIQMKKNRPGTMVTCLCPVSEKDKFVRLLFAHSTTLGIRENRCGRYTLGRREEVKQTEFGDIPIKVSEGYGVRHEKLEYANLETIAKREQCSLLEIKDRIK